MQGKDIKWLKLEGRNYPSFTDVYFGHLLFRLLSLTATLSATSGMVLAIVRNLIVLL